MPNKVLAVGLGNPGSKYLFTRHNVGFMIMDRLAKKLGIEFIKSANSLIASKVVEDKELILMKPQTFMNLSGKALQLFLSQNSVENVIVIYDDVDMPPGRMKVKPKGSSTHNGVRSIISFLESKTSNQPTQKADGAGHSSLSDEKGNSLNKNFIHVRIGIGKGKILSEHVLEDFSKTELQELDSVIERAAFCVVELLKKDIGSVMNEYNERS